MSGWSEINEFFRKITIYKVRKFFHIKEIHWNNGEGWGQKNNMKELLQLALVVRETWWKAKGEEMRLVWVSQGALMARPWILNLATGKDTLEDSNCKNSSCYWQQWEIMQDKLERSDVCGWEANKEEHHVWHMLSSWSVYKWVGSLMCPLSNFLSTPVLDFKLSRNQKGIGKVIWQQLTAAKSSRLLSKVLGLAG